MLIEKPANTVLTEKCAKANEYVQKNVQRRMIMCFSKYKCCFCGKEFHGYGNNPAPVINDKDAKCCDSCNWKVVVPRRKREVQNRFWEEEIYSLLEEDDLWEE